MGTHKNIFEHRENRRGGKYFGALFLTRLCAVLSRGITQQCIRAFLFSRGSLVGRHVVHNHEIAGSSPAPAI